MARTINMHTDLQISSCWEHIRLETCMNSLVKVPPYSKLNIQRKIFFTQNWCNITNFRLFCSDDCRSWPREEKINIHGCWGKHAHIPDNDYWGICLFHVVWTIVLLVQLFLYGTHGIYFNLHPTFFSSTEQCIWAIISPKEFKSWVTRISFALGVVYLWWPLDVYSWLVYFGDGMLSPWHNSISVHFT
jgi:hypothetical protein